jgi:hypothetical protein
MGTGEGAAGTSGPVRAQRWTALAPEGRLDTGGSGEEVGYQPGAHPADGSQGQAVHSGGADGVAVWVRKHS